jgi:tetratricopeptide (TPR) repeat protein
MFCSKFGGECPHTVIPDDKYVFVMMPFKNFDSVYDAIKMAMEGIKDKEFVCERADERYTNRAIWCDQICKSIRKSKYLIVDTTHRNPNVFYELGFAHAMGDNTRAIIITQNIEEAPFDVRDLGHIIYSEKNLPKLREDLKKAIIDLEKEEVEEESYENKSPEELINELKSQLRAEEERASKFKKELTETEERERKLKESIREIEAIQDNPVEEAKDKIAELEGSVAELKSKLRFTEKDKKDTIEKLTKTLKEKEKKLKILEEKFESYKESKDVKTLSDSLLDDAKRRTEAEEWSNRAYEELKKGNYSIAVNLSTKAIELNPGYATAYLRRGWGYNELKEYEKALRDYNKAIELNPRDDWIYNNRGKNYSDLKEYDKAISDYNKAIELDPKCAGYYNSISEIYIMVGNYKSALKNIEKALSLSLETEDIATCLYLECIAKKMLDMDISDCEKKFNEILKKDFTTRWSSDEIEIWLADADITADKKSFILEKTEQLKKHKR